MSETISLGVGGDINLIKSRIISNPDCVFPVSIVKETPQDDITYFNFEFDEDILTLDKYLNVLAEYVIDRYETKIIRKIMEEQFGDLSQNAKRDIIKNITTLTDNKEIGYNARKKCILMALYECLTEAKRVYLDGFISFRLKEYEHLLYRVIEQLADNYTTKKEYEEFIELLKYFVEIQSPRPELLNIFAEKSGGYRITNEKGMDITSKCMSEFVSDATLLKETDYDDILISVLITAAPQKLIIHNAQNITNHDLFLTIKKVFDKVEYCTGCDMCVK